MLPRRGATVIAALASPKRESTVSMAFDAPIVYGSRWPLIL